MVLGYGDNTAAMLMTRGLAEMSRLTVKCGGQAITCMGLAGAGDLIATCTSEHSRNRSFGVELAQGGTLDGYRERTHMVVEGALACKTLKTLSEAYNVELPITDVVRGVVWEGADPKAAAKDLFARPIDHGVLRTVGLTSDLPGCIVLLDIVLPMSGCLQQPLSF